MVAMQKTVDGSLLAQRDGQVQDGAMGVRGEVGLLEWRQEFNDLVEGLIVVDQGFILGVLATAIWHRQDKPGTPARAVIKYGSMESKWLGESEPSIGQTQTKRSAVAGVAL